MEGKHPRESLLLDERQYRLVHERFHHAELEAHPQEAASDEWCVLLIALAADEADNDGLTEPVDAVARRADGLEVARIELCRKCSHGR